MADQFKYLFSPIKIGPITVPNRIVFTPHGIGFGKDWAPSDQMCCYHAERAKGGCGLISIEGVFAAPEPESYSYLFQLRLWDEAGIPAYRKLTDMVHQYGTKIFVELFGWGTVSGRGPSDLPGLWYRLTARASTVAEIEEWVEYFGISAENAKKAGFDGIELHASHGFAIQQFNSPLWNRRTDKYGGTFEKRLTFMLEVIDRVRKGIGDNMALGIRLDADELFPGGYTLEDGKKIAQIIEQTGKIDFISVDTALEPHQAHLMTAPMYAPLGYMVGAAAAIREVLEKTPVICAGRIVDPIYAEKILADGQADLIGMCRAQIADPELANKAREGRLDDIRPCLGDNENCFPRVLFGGLRCTGNARAGREAKLGLEGIQPAKVKKNVLVAGGGVAGMEAARVATLRGHKVTLYEKTQSLGGQVNLAAMLPGRDEIGGIGRWLKGQIAKLGVEVRLGEELTSDKVRQLKPDAVVVATGSAFYRNGLSGFTFTTIPGWESEIVATPEEILTGKKIAGNKVIIADLTTYIVGLGLAEILVNQGKSVQIVTMDPAVGLGLAPVLQTPWVFPRIMSKVTLTPDTAVAGISDHTVTLMKLYSYETSTIEGVDTVIMATAKEPNNSLYHALQGSGLDVHVIGDADIPVNGTCAIGEAIRAGYDLAVKL